MIDFQVAPYYLDPNFLHQKYMVERLSTTEIAAQIFSSRSTVTKYLRFHGIPIRETGVNIIRRRGLGYGSKVRCRLQEPHQIEQATIEKMRGLRGSGHSYWKIADILNTMKVPTKTKDTKWHARTVHRIISKGSSPKPEATA